jgi:uncharacterized protein (TIGR03437 family)
VNSVSNPARPGSIVVLWATGAGETEPQGLDGRLATGTLPKPLAPVSVLIDGRYAEILYAGAAPGLVAGLMQVNVRIPPGVKPRDAVPVILNAGSESSQEGVYISIR